MPHQGIHLGGVRRPVQFNVLDGLQLIRTELGIYRLVALRSASVLKSAFCTPLARYTIRVDPKLLRSQNNIVKVGRAEVSLAHGAVAVSSEPEPHAVLAELVAADGEDSCHERSLADNAYSRLTRL